MALIFFDGFENDFGTGDPQNYLFGYYRVQSGSFNSGINGNRYLQNPGNVRLSIPEESRSDKGILSFLVYHTTNLYGNVGTTLVAVMEGDEEVASIRFAGSTNNFPVQYITYELFVAGVQVGTFNYNNWNSWERWVLVWDASGPAVTASVYRQSVLQASGIGGQIDTTPITPSYSFAVYDQAGNWTLKINSVTEDSGYTYSNVYSTNFAADIGDEITATESYRGRAAIFDGPNLTGNVIHNFGYDFSSASMILSDPPQGYTRSGKASWVRFQNINGNHFDSVTVWDDPSGDLSAARGPHWIQSLSTLEPSSVGSGDWQSYYDNVSPNGSIAERIRSNNANQGAKTSIADSDLDVTFKPPAIPSDVVGVYGTRDIWAARATESLPNLEQRFKVGSSFSSGKIIDASAYTSARRFNAIDPTTSLPYETSVAEELVLDRTAEGGFNPTTGWIIDDANSVNKYYIGELEGVGEGPVVYPSQDGGSTLGMRLTGSGSWFRYDTFYIYKDLDVTDLNGVYNFLSPSFRARIPSNNTTAFFSIFDPTQNNMPSSVSDLRYGYNQLPEGAGVSRTNDFLTHTFSPTEITGNTMRIAFQFSTRWDQARYSEEAFPIIDWFEVFAFNAPILSSKSVFTARE